MTISNRGVGWRADAHSKYVGGRAPDRKTPRAPLPCGSSPARRVGSVSVTLPVRQGCPGIVAEASVIRVNAMSSNNLAASPETFSAGPMLTQEQKRWIGDSFTRIEPAADLVARLFYLKSVEL